MSSSAGECDFCGTANTVAWAYPCRDFTTRSPLPGVLPDQGSSGAWAACGVCHALIERSDRQRLAQRSAKKLTKRTGVPFKLALRAVAAIQGDFYANREGEALPTTTGANDPTPVGAIAPQHQLGPDKRAMAEALGIGDGQMKAITGVNSSDVHIVATVFFAKDDGIVYRANVALQGDTYVRAGEDVSLGGDWDSVRIAVDLGLGHL